MNIYHLIQSAISGYDTYSDAVVVAESFEEARLMHPDGGPITKPGNDTWPTNPDDVEAKLIGVALDGGKRVVCASFHAG